MHLSRQRIAAVTLLLMFSAAVGIIVFEHLERLNSVANEVMTSTREAAEADVTRSALAHDIRFHAEHGAIQLSRLFVQKEQVQRVTVYAEMDKHSAAIDQAIVRITPLLASAAEKESLAHLIKLRERFRDNLQETVDALELGEREKAEILLATVTRDNLQELRGMVEQLIKGQIAAAAMRQHEALQRRSATEAGLSHERQMILALGLAAWLSGLLLGGILMRESGAPRSG